MEPAGDPSLGGGTYRRNYQHLGQIYPTSLPRDQRRGCRHEEEGTDGGAGPGGIVEHLATAYICIQTPGSAPLLVSTAGMRTERLDACRKQPQRHGSGGQGG